MDEINKAIMTEKPSRVFQMLDSTRLLELVFPELNALKGVEVVEGVSHKDNFLHTLKVLDNVSEKSDNLWLRWAAILHDIAKACTRKFDAEAGWTFHGHDYVGYKMVPGIFKRMKMPLDDRMRYVQKMVLLHLRPISLVQDEVSDSAIRRLLFDAGDDIDDLMTLCEADITSKNEERVQRHLLNFSRLRDKLKEIEEKDSIRNFQPPVSGDEIQRTFNIEPGPVIGIIKNHIKESILDGIIPNEYEAAKQLMIEKGKELGLVVSG
jgi:poly(A) polymerase